MPTNGHPHDNGHGLHPIPATSGRGGAGHETHTPSGTPVASSAPKRGGGLRLAVGLVLLAIVGAAAWHFTRGGASSPASAAAAAAHAAPPAAVTVRTVAPKSLRLWSEFSGRLQAVDSAEVRPQVGGQITEIRFEDGQAVKAGDVLFVIDPRPYEAAVARAEARVASTKADLQFSTADRQRATGLLASKAIAQREYDQADNASGVASAALEAAEADLKTARLNLDYAYVKAPIAGRASRAEITVGNLVLAAPTAPLLTTVVSQDGIYADFEVDEQTYLQTIRDAASGNAQERLIPVRLLLPGGGKEYEGFIESFDNRLDTRSGTIRARAKFANADGTLVPGMFVTVELAGSRERSVILVPERAVGVDQSKKFVFVAGADGKAAYRAVEAGRTVGRERVIEAGLQPGDRVIVDGLQHVRPGAPVAPTEEANPAQAPAAETAAR